VALQGTIETFALPDVLRLLASTKKAGCLRLSGTRGHGSVWVTGGQIVGGEVSSAPHADGAVEVVFELLRFSDGGFVFDADISPPNPSLASDIEPVLIEAQRMLDEWSSVTAVVPSTSAWVSLATELPADEVTIERDRWRVLAAIGHGTTVGELGDRLELGELAVFHTVKDLVEAGLTTVGAPPEPAVVSAPLVEADEAEAPLAPVETDPGASTNGHDDAFDPFDPDSLVVDRDAIHVPEPLAEPAVVGAPADYDDRPGDAAEIARQLANLSPKAAKAVAAAAKATTDAERQAALAQVDDTEDPINRDLLIKFLGSVNG
jgi:hypothetical protein